MSDSPPPTLLDRIIATLKNNILLASLGALGVVVTGLGMFTDSLDSLLRFWRSDSSQRVEEYCELLSPLVVQFDRTLDAVNRYTPRDFALEQTLEDGNRKAREILESKAQLVRPTLDSARRQLIAHYDRWLEEYARVRRINADSVTAFIFVGPKGSPFPQWAEIRFRARRDSIATSLGSTFACRARR